MKRSKLVAVFVMMLAFISNVSHAANIEIVSQTYAARVNELKATPEAYEMYKSYLDGLGVAYTISYRELQNVYDVYAASSFPFIIDFTSSQPEVAAYVELASPSSLQMSNIAMMPNSMTSDIIFRTIAASYLDIAVSCAGMDRFDGEFQLIDQTNGIELLNMWVSPSMGQYYRVTLPVTPGGTYELIISAIAVYDPGRVWATVTAIPEPTSLLLLCSGLIGLKAGRRFFGQKNE